MTGCVFVWRSPGRGVDYAAAPDEFAKIVVTTAAKNVSSEIASSDIDRLIRKELGDGSLTEKASSLLKKIGS